MTGPQGAAGVRALTEHLVDLENELRDGLHSQRCPGPSPLTGPPRPAQDTSRRSSWATGRAMGPLPTTGTLDVPGQPVVQGPGGPRGGLRAPAGTWTLAAGVQSGGWTLRPQGRKGRGLGPGPESCGPGGGETAPGCAVSSASYLPRCALNFLAGQTELFSPKSKTRPQGKPARWCWKGSPMKLHESIPGSRPRRFCGQRPHPGAGGGRRDPSSAPRRAAFRPWLVTLPASQK